MSQYPREGRLVRCVTCGRIKKPVGRDSQDPGLCDHECSGYWVGDEPDDLWPGEVER